MTPAKLKKVGSEARCAVNKEGSQATSMQLLHLVSWALCFLVGPIVGHGSRRVRSRSSNAVLLHMLHNMSDMQGPPEHSMIKLNSQHTSFRVQQ